MDDSVFESVATSREWDELDKIGNVTLKNGEKVEVLWPDRTKSIEEIMVITGKKIKYNYASETTVKAKKAYLVVDYKGVGIRLPLQGSEIKLRRVLNE
jgi:hypothetical protein